MVQLLRWVEAGQIIRGSSRLPLALMHSTAVTNLDSYCFLRFLRMILRLFVFLATIFLPILLPLHMVHGKGPDRNVHGLDRLSIANIGMQHDSFYWGHLTLSALGISIFCILVYREFEHLTQVRSQYLRADRDRTHAMPQAVLLSNIPSSYRSASNIRSLYQKFSADIRAVILHRNARLLAHQIQLRDQTVETLEIAETKLINAALKDSNAEYSTMPTCRPLTTVQRDIAISASPKLISIERLRTSVQDLNEKIRSTQSNSNQFTVTDSAFVLFNNIQAAVLASSSLALNTPRQMSSQYIGATTDDILWNAIGLSWWNTKVRTLAVFTTIALLCVGWTAPVALTGAVSQITYLTRVFPWLEPVAQLPPFVLGSLQGFVPQAILTICTAVVPTLIRWLVQHQGLAVGRDVEHTVQIYYFWFLFLQILLTVSLSSSLATVVGQALDHRSTIPNLLATSLPKTSNYFFSYLLLQGLSVSESNLLQIPGLLGRIVIGQLADVFVRQRIRRRFSFRESQWGTEFPVFTLFACIGRQFRWWLFTAADEGGIQD